MQTKTKCYYIIKRDIANYAVIDKKDYCFFCISENSQLDKKPIVSFVLIVVVVAASIT